ncbi:hypothetical protein ACFX1R_010766 [Malus domestica]
MIREASLEKKPVIPLFPLLEEKKDKGKKKEKPESSRPDEEIQETSLPNPLIFPLDGRGQIELEGRKFGMT